MILAGSDTLRSHHCRIDFGYRSFVPALGAAVDYHHSPCETDLRNGHSLPLGQYPRLLAADCLDLVYRQMARFLKCSTVKFLLYLVFFLCNREDLIVPV